MIAKKGLPYNNLELVANCKEHFLTLCKMYEHMGILHKLQAKAMKHPLIARSTVPQTQGRIVEQYQEMGEEMKNIGELLDLMGGKPVMRAEEPQPQSTDDGKTFVSNTEPPKEDEKPSAKKKAPAKKKKAAKKKPAAKKADKDE